MRKTGPLEKDFPEGASLTLQFKPRKSYLELRNYVNGDFFDMASLWDVVEAVHIMNGHIENRQAIRDYVESRQAGSGGFDDMLDTRNQPENDKAHVIVTHHAVMILKTLGFEVPNSKQVARWIRACQTSEGGFRWSPDNLSYSNQPDVWYTCAAIEALEALGEKPRNSEACLNWLNSLQNADGGFGDRPGWDSRLYSTFYAVHAIDMLTGDVRKGIHKKLVNENKEQDIPEGIYSIFQAHQKSPAGGSEMVDSIAAMKLNFIAVKSTEKEVINSNGMSETVRKAKAYAKEKGYPLEIVDCPENYAHRLVWFSGLKGNHGSDMILPPNLSDAQWKTYLSAYNEGLKGDTWQVFKQKVIKPMLDIGTLFYPELDYTMLNAYMVYDEGLDGETGYNAVPAAHFGNYDWVRHFPYKERWLGHLPMIADGDAHGDIHKWRPYLESFRNVFIARSYHYSDYIDASQHGRSVCVIRMPGTDEIRYYGSKAAIAYLERHIDEWKWW